MKINAAQHIRPSPAAVIAASALFLATAAFAVTPGSLDSTYGTQGVALSSVGDDGVLAATLQTDNKLLTATLADAGGDRASLVITRFTTGGVVDSSFASAGVATVSVNTDKLSTVHAMLRQNSDNKIVVTGRSVSAFATTRLTSAGSIDSGFGTGGTVKTTIGGDDEAYAIAQQTDGKLVVVGAADDGADSDFAIVRYTNGGAPDPLFSGDGIATVDFGGNDVARAVAIDSNGSIVVAGASTGSKSNIAIARLTSNGSPDATFGSGGKVTTSITARDDVAYAVLVQTDNRIVIAGEADEGFVVARYLTNGQPDGSFGTGGITRTNIEAGVIDGARALVRQADDKFVAAGTVASAPAPDFAVVRYTSGGVPDSTFGSGGLAITSVAALFSEDLSALLLQSDGKLLAAGLSDDGSTSYQIVARYVTSTSALCGDADQNGSVTASDALRVLRNAVGQADACPLFICDVDSNALVQASDALRVLKKAVGQPITLTCPPAG